MKKNLANKLGFWSASIFTLLLSISAVATTASIQPLGLITGLLLTPIFILMIACIHYHAPDEKKILSLIGLSFAIIYVSMISMNYYIQLTLVRHNSFDVSIFAMDNPKSIMWVIEILGYFFMGLSTLFVAPIFKSGKLEKSIRWLFIANGILGIVGFLIYPFALEGFVLGSGTESAEVGLMVWNVVMPLSTLLLAYFFKQKL